jgi:hypothetical protein
MPQNLRPWPWRIRRRGRRSLSLSLAVLAGAAGFLAACGRGDADWRQAEPAPPASGQEAGYVRAPQLTGAERTPAGGVNLTGQSDPLDRIRLSAPGGAAYGATADAKGRWTILVPPAEPVRLFGLSEVLAGRSVQSEGYIALPPAPGQTAVVLRAGVGALTLGGAPAHPRITTVDCDAAGGAVISGLARPGAALHLLVDGGVAADARADGDGRFSVALAAALKAGDHEAMAQSGADSARVQFRVDAPQPITGLPFRGQRLADRWRLDWITPGGGVQTTYILD